MRRPTPSWAVLTLALAAAPSLALEAPRKVVDYDIAVELFPAAKELVGTETLRWTNPSAEKVDELRFHLYWNAFRNNRSTFFKESGGRLRGDRADQEEGWGSIDLKSMTWEGTDLAKGARFVSPDDGNRDDRTVVAVPLPRPVEPGETITLKIGWKGKFPKVFARAGYVREFFFAGQWFPKIGVLEPAGVRRRATTGWNCHQYHANSEFYSDWGDYRVAITVPERFVVGSAGALVSEKAAGGKKTLTYEQKAIHDFAWTADPLWVVREDVFDPAKDLPEAEVQRASRLLGRSPEELRKGFHPVKLRFLFQPDSVSQWTRHADAQKWALAWFGLYAFPYPYAQVTCVSPPQDGLGAGGMEYQTLYTTTAVKPLGHWPLRDSPIGEMVTIHEFGHGYWYGLVASNEFEESWMDEGINSFTEYEMVDRKYGALVRLPPGLTIPDEEQGRIGTIAAEETDPILRTSWGYSSSGAYSRNSYIRPATVLEQIRRLQGEDRFWKGLKAYAERWRFDHPTSEDAFDAFQAAAPEVPLRPLIDQTFHGTGTIDLAVRSASSRRHEALTGIDDAGKLVNPDPAGGKAPKGKKRPAKDDRPFLTRVLVARQGEIVLPAEIVLTFENGTTWKTTWDGNAPWIRLTTVYPSRLVKAEVDPGRKVVLDKDPWNNARYLDGWKGASAGRKAATYALHLVQILLSSLWALV